jgi:two-component system, chemotaxis family, chemotaxis protein CheY
MNAPTVLVIEDDYDSRDMVCEWLRQHGYRCIGAVDGHDGLTRLEELPQLSLILLDLMMPGMSGWQFRAIQRDHARYGSVPVVVLTAHANPHAESLSLGAQDVLMKPLDLRTLLKVVLRYAGPAREAVR